MTVKSHRQLSPEVWQDTDEKVPLLFASAPRSVQLSVTPFVVRHELGIV